MKLKFLLVALVVFGFSVGSHADCTKDEIMNMMNKGISSSIINTTCGKKNESKWITPSKSVCISNGGKMKHGVCRAKWSNAKDICSVSNARLPTRYELEKVIVDCRGIIRDFESNKKNTSYQSCYMRKGFFSSHGNWSSTLYASDFSNAWLVNFYNGNVARSSKMNNFSVRCVMVGE